MADWTVNISSLSEVRSEWEALNENVPFPSPFSAASWLTILANVYHREPLIAMLRKDGVVRAGVPLLLKSRGKMLYCPPLPISMNAGLLHSLNDEDGTEALPMLFDAVERHCHFAALSFSATDDEQRLLIHRRWRLHNRVTRRVRIDDIDALWSGYSQSLRRKLRRAEEQQLTLMYDVSPKLVVDMYEASYRRHGIRPPIPGSSIAEWLRSLRAEGIIESFAAYRVDGVPAAVRVCIRHGDVVYDWLAGADPIVSESASHWLVHAILCKYSYAGAREFDFMGANTPGVADFKRSFGGDVLPYVDAEWYRSSFIRYAVLLRGTYVKARRRAT